MASIELIYINFTGGIVSPGYLKEVLEIAASAKVTNVGFGLRQQLMMEMSQKYFASFNKACKEKNIKFEKEEIAIPNIVSSYQASGIFTTDSWLREGVYKDVFNFFDYTPKLKINISDSSQSFVPFFTGHLNWISSESSHFWYLYIRLPKTPAVYCFPALVYTNDIASVSKHLEKLILSESVLNGQELYKQAKETLHFISKPIDKELEMPKFSLPYYEGFNKHDNTYWLGIYRRDQLFSVYFLIEVCNICLQTKIGQLYTTPWKSIIIKGIESKHRNLWDYVLGTYRINVRHAANELNWQVEDNNEEGLMLKRHIIRHFDKEDVRTYGLSFAVKTKPFSSMFGSVIIRKQQSKNANRLKSLDRFEILYTNDFNSNSSNYKVFRKDVEKDYLGIYLVSLCKFFYDRESDKKSLLLGNLNDISNPITDKKPAKIIHQCKHCFTIYDETLGDAENNIPAGTTFANVPESYKCPLCEAGKKDFIEVAENSLLLPANSY